MAIEESEKPVTAQPANPSDQIESPPSPSSSIDLETEKLKAEQSDTQPEAVSKDAAQEADAEVEYPSGIKLTLITLALCFSIFCMALDNTIIATAIPRITDDFKSLNDVGWYGSSYLLTTCAFQLLYGKVYTFYSIKWVFLIALGIFEIGSAVCGGTPNSMGFIIGRAVAGLGAAGIFSGALLIVAHTVPLVKRPMFTGMIASMYGIASVAGPLLGGVFTDHVTWRWCFYINLPFGAVTAAFIIFFFKSPVVHDDNVDLVRTQSGNHTTKMTWTQKIAQFDLAGTVVFIPSVVCLLLALQWGGSTYPWRSWRIILCLVMFAVLMTAFLVIQVWKGENATVPPRIIRQRTVGASCFFVAGVGAAFFVLVYFIPIWFQAIKGVSAVKSGIMNLPLILGLVIVSLVAGAGVTLTGYFTPFCIASSVFMAVGAGLLTTFTTTTNHPVWIGYQFIFGAGVGLGMQQPMIAVQTVLPLKDVPVGTALVMFCQTLGGALFISVAQNIFTNELLQNLRDIVPDVNPAVVLSSGATTLRDHIATGDLAGVLSAYNKTLTTTWYVSVATGAISILGAVFMEWKSVKGKQISPGAA